MRMLRWVLVPFLWTSVPCPFHGPSDHLAATERHVKRSGKKSQSHRHGKRTHTIPNTPVASSMPVVQPPLVRVGVPAFGEALLVLDEDLLVFDRSVLAMNVGGASPVGVQFSSGESTLTVAEKGTYQASTFLFAKAPNNSSSIVTYGLSVNGHLSQPQMRVIPANYDVDGDNLQYVQTAQWVLTLNAGDTVSLYLEAPVPFGLYFPAHSPAASASLSLIRVNGNESVK